MTINSFSQLPLLDSTVITGTDGEDTLSGFLGNDIIYGGFGSDTLFEGMAVWGGDAAPGLVPGKRYDFGHGSDVLKGDSGYDLLIYASTKTSAVLNLSTQTVTRGSEIDKYSSIENISLGDGNDRVVGRTDQMTLGLGGGNDTLDGTSGFDFASGGLGIDLVDYSNSGAVVYLSLATSPFPDSYKLMEFEIIKGVRSFANILIAGPQDVTFIGGDLADRLVGQDGNDVLYGRAGADKLYGGAHNDRLYGGGGTSILEGGAGNDRIYGGVEADRLFGGSGRDSLYAGAGDDLIADSVGRAIVFAGNGNDIVRLGSENGTGYLFRGSASGGEGNDTIILNSGNFAISSREIFSDGALISVSGFEHIIFGTRPGSSDQIITDMIGMDGLHLGVGNDNLITSFSGKAYFLGSGNDQGVINGDRTVLWSGAGNDDVHINGAFNTCRLGSGDDRASVLAMGKDNLVYTGDGNDFVDTGNSAGWNRFFTGNGDDQAVINGATDLDTGAGNDQVDLDYNSGPVGSIIRTGAGDDEVISDGRIQLLDLGVGSDFARLRGLSTVYGGGWRRQRGSSILGMCSVHW